MNKYTLEMFIVKITIAGSFLVPPKTHVILISLHIPTFSNIQLKHFKYPGSYYSDLCLNISFKSNRKKNPALAFYLLKTVFRMCATWDFPRVDHLSIANGNCRHFTIILIYFLDWWLSVFFYRDIQKQSGEEHASVGRSCHSQAILPSKLERAIAKACTAHRG